MRSRVGVIPVAPRDDCFFLKQVIAQEVELGNRVYLRRRALNDDGPDQANSTPSARAYSSRRKTGWALKNAREPGWAALPDIEYSPEKITPKACSSTQLTQ